MSIEVEVDERQRVSLRKVLGKNVSRLRAEQLPDGSVLLTPLVASLSQRELDALTDPKVSAGIRAGVEDSKAGRVTRYPAGHFTALAMADAMEELSENEAAAIDEVIDEARRENGGSLTDEEEQRLRQVCLHLRDAYPRS